MKTVRSHVRSQMTWLALMDLTCLFLSGFIAIRVRLGHEEMIEYVFKHREGWLLLFGGIVVANYLAGSYKLQYTFSRFNLLVTWFFSLVFAMLIVGLTSYAWFMWVLGRGVLALTLGTYSVLSLCLKLLVYRSLFRSEAFVCRTVILGIGNQAKELRKLVENEYILPAHKVIAFVDVCEDRDTVTAGSVVCDGVAAISIRTGALADLVKSLGASLIIIGMEDARDAAKLYPQLKRLRFEGVEVLTPLAVAEIYSGRTPLDQLTEESLMQASMESNLPLVRRVKRLIDIMVSLVAIVFLAPFALGIALLIKLSAPRSPVFYSQDRVGHFGNTFRIYKYRTMRPDAEAVTGPVWSAVGDPRITRIGAALRRLRIDELPQFINILRGDMSLVGPRPERPSITNELVDSIPYYQERENIMPGLTGWAQIRYPYGNTVQDAARKLEYDLYYIKNLSLSFDLQILLRTLRIVVFGKEKRA